MNAIHGLLMLLALIGPLPRAAGWQAQSEVSITGVVVDPSGASIPGAAVSLTSAGTQIRVATDAEGRFTLKGVAAGSYVLRAAFSGLEPVEQSIEAGLTPDVAVRLVLQVAAERQQVNVSASSGGTEEESVSLDRNADRLNFEREILDSLPAPGEDPLAIAARFVSPAASGADSSVSVIIDGVEVSAANLPARALRRIRVNRNPYAAEFRQPGKSRIEAYSEEGSLSRFHASASLSGRNSALESRNALASEKPDTDRLLFEGSISGPIQRKRMGFVISGERVANDSTAIVHARTPAGLVTGNFPSPERRTGFLGRVDWKTASDRTGSLSVNWRSQEERGRGVGGLRLPDQAYTAQADEWRIQFSERGVYGGVINDVRLTVERGNREVGAKASSATLKVLGAFTSGPSAVWRTERETEFKAQEILGFWKGSHSLRLGAEARMRRIHRRDASNFAGTFEYSSLDDFRAGRPFVFRINQGNPSVQVNPYDLAFFIQDEFKPKPEWSLTLGLRYSFQADVPDRNDFAPRLALAFAPGDRRTVLRLGAGLFLDRVSSEVRQQHLLYSMELLREVVVLGPSPLNPLSGGDRLLPSIIRAGSVRTPTVIQASASIERELWSRTHVTAEYATLRGTHLQRSRNINAPRLLFGGTPEAQFLNINQVESSASSMAHLFGVTLRAGIGRLSGMAQYSFSRAEDDTDGRFSLPADNFNLRPEWGRSDSDQRHRLTAVSTLELPAGVRIGSSFTFGSGGPFDITTGRDDNGDSVANDRPRGVTRNTGLGPSFMQWDVRATKRLRAPRLIRRGADSASRNVELNIDVFNVWNRPNYTRYVGNQSSPLFGQPDTAGQPRAFQLSLRYRF